MRRSLDGDAQVKQGKPINFYRGTKPCCMFCNLIPAYHSFECTKPGRRDSHEYTESCLETDWIICPLNPNNLVKEFNKLVEAGESS